MLISSYTKSGGNDNPCNAGLLTQVLGSDASAKKIRIGLNGMRNTMELSEFKPYHQKTQRCWSVRAPKWQNNCLDKIKDTIIETLQSLWILGCYG